MPHELLRNARVSCKVQVQLLRWSDKITGRTPLNVLSKRASGWIVSGLLPVCNNSSLAGISNAHQTVSWVMMCPAADFGCGYYFARKIKYLFICIMHTILHSSAVNKSCDFRARQQPSQLIELSLKCGIGGSAPSTVHKANDAVNTTSCRKISFDHTF